MAWVVFACLAIAATFIEEINFSYWVIQGSWLFSATLSSLFALVQYFGISDAFAFVSPAKAGEAFANLRQRNQFATLTNIGVAVLLWRAWVPGLGGMRERLEGIAAPLFMLLLVAVNAASASRTGLVQLGLVLALFAAWQRGNVRAVWKNARFMAAVLGYVAAALLFAVLAGYQKSGGGILGRVEDTGDHCSSRLTLWSNVWHLIRLQPWAGWGWGELDYAHFITLYPGERFCEILDNAHNLPLHLAVELGLPVALVFCAGVVWWVIRARPWAEPDPTRQLAWAVLALIGLHSMLEYPLWYGPFQIAVVLCLLMLWRPQQKLQQGTTGQLALAAHETPHGGFHGIFRSNGAVGRIFIALAATLSIAFLAAVGWDYWRISQLYLPAESRAAAYKDDTMAKVKNSWFFQDQVRFAELTTTPLTRNNAAYLNAMAQRLLHFSPEASVVEVLIESAVMLGRYQEAMFYLQRYKAAFPQAHARWAARLPGDKAP